jgi:hypothetical protein
MSNTRYANTIFGSTSGNLIDRIQKIHNKAVKILFKNSSNMSKHTTELYKDIKMLNVKQLISYSILTQNFNKAEFKIPVERGVRNNNKWLKEPTWRNSYGRRGLKYQVPYQFNKLPADLRNIKSIYIFKKQVKQWLINQ